MPAAPVIDFSDDRYDSLRTPENLMDADHLNHHGVEVFSNLVIERMQEMLHNRSPAATANSVSMR